MFYLILGEHVTEIQYIVAADPGVASGIDELKKEFRGWYTFYKKIMLCVLFCFARVQILLFILLAFQEASLSNQIKILEELKQLKILVLNSDGPLLSSDDASPKWPLRNKLEFDLSLKWREDKNNFHKTVCLHYRIISNLNTVLYFICIEIIFVCKIEYV